MFLTQKNNSTRLFIIKEVTRYFDQEINYKRWRLQPLMGACARTEVGRRLVLLRNVITAAPVWGVSAAMTQGDEMTLRYSLSHYEIIGLSSRQKEPYFGDLQNQQNTMEAS